MGVGGGREGETSKNLQPSFAKNGGTFWTNGKNLIFSWFFLIVEKNPNSPAATKNPCPKPHAHT